MSCTWYNPELPNPNGRPQCASCNGTQYNVTISNSTLYTLNSVNISNIPIDMQSGAVSCADTSSQINSGAIGFLVTNICGGCSTPIPKFTPKPTSPMTLSFTDVGDGKPSYHIYYSNAYLSRSSAKNGGRCHLYR